MRAPACLAFFQRPLQIADLGAHVFHVRVDLQSPAETLEGSQRVEHFEIAVAHADGGRKVVRIALQRLTAITHRFAVALTLVISNGPLVDLYRTLFDYSLRYGYDSESGGFYDSGPINKPADKRQKVWWVQSECMVSALYMYCMTGDSLYYDCFVKTLDWIKEHQKGKLA